ncbi:MAG: hypothetical protein NT023_02645, partial [Armatimonadetes bacterium]|nr:hypothetical protein [Armatimonadota bacterium]
KVSNLQKIFLDELRPMLPDWKFVAGQRHFKKAVGPLNWYFHISFVNHTDDFDAVGDVAVEFVENRQRSAIVGAQLGNISGVGQTRHGVNSPTSAVNSACSLLSEFREVGLPFLERYSELSTTLETLESGGREALLISPIQQFHAEQVSALRKIASMPNHPFQRTPDGAAEQ